MSPPGSWFQRFDPLAGRESQNVFDPGVWGRASAVQDFTAELIVTQGSVEIRLEALESGTAIAVLRGNAADAAARSVLLSLSDGAVLPVVERASQDAVYRLRFGTYQKPNNPDRRVGFLVKAGSAQTIARLCELYQQFVEQNLDQNAGADSRLFFDTGRFNPRPLRKGVTAAGVHVLAGSRHSFPRRAAYEISFGRLRGQECTDVCILHADQDPIPQLFLRALMMARFMPQDRFFHDPELSAHWPAALFDRRCLYDVGLPGSDLEAYLSNLERTGARQRITPAALAKAVPIQRPTVARRIWQRLSPARPRSPGRADSDLQRELYDCQRQQTQSSRAMISLLKDRHQGRRAVVIGNGPSLEISDLNRLMGEVTFASNKIYLAYDQTDWRPTYYSVEDSLVIQNNRQAIADLTGSIKILPDTVRAMGFTDGSAIFPRLMPPKSFQDPLSDPDFPRFSGDLCQGLCWGSTITYSQIQMAIHMGCREIVMIGVDHSYTLPSVKQGNTYLYEGERNHFHPDYRAAGEKWHQPNLDVLGVSYRKARDACAARGVAILNASRRTRLDVFERADFDLLFPPETDPHRHRLSL